MTIASSILPEFDNEMRITRSLLERVPAERASWQPHAKSMTLGRLATHLPELVGMIPSIMEQPDLDILAAGAPPAWKSTDETLAAFDRAVTAARASIAARDDAAMGETWTFRAGSHVVAAVPRIGALRSFIMNHVIHHRGQLSVYLRLVDVALPEIYGPNADSAR